MQPHPEGCASNVAGRVEQHAPLIYCVVLRNTSATRIKLSLHSPLPPAWHPPFQLHTRTLALARVPTEAQTHNPCRPR
eukprot:6195132-Pleurochrysis_carterae.AAC.1